MLSRAPRGESRAPLPHVRVVTGDGNDGRKRVGTVIAVANQKGGVGKTTCTINLGGAFASLGHRVLCLDLDPQANLTVGLGIDLNTVEKNIANVLIDPDLKLASIIRPTKTKNLDVAPATLELSSAEVELFNAIGREMALRDKLTRSPSRIG